MDVKSREILLFFDEEPEMLNVWNHDVLDPARIKTAGKNINTLRYEDGIPL